METENTPSSGKKFLIWGILAFAILGSVLTFVGSGSGGIMSQFSGTNVTPSTASSMWLPSLDNPKRAAVTEYADVLNAFVKKILNKGSGKSNAEFSAYLTKLSATIRTIMAKPEYANEKEIQDVLGYLVFEFDATTRALASSNTVVDLLASLDTETATAPTAPVITVTRDAGASRSLVNWTRENGVDYYLSIDDDGIEKKSTSAAQWSINWSEFAPGSTHAAKVKACSAANPALCSDWSTASFVVPANAVAPSAPTAPTISMTQDGTRSLVTWTRESGMDYYVAIDTGTGAKFPSTAAWPIYFSQFTPGSTHIAKVKACSSANPALCSDWSTASIAVPTGGTATGTVPKYAWALSNDNGNTHVWGTNPWSMKNWWVCGTCGSDNVWAFCSKDWKTYPATDRDCPGMACGMRMVCRITP